MKENKLLLYNKSKSQIYFYNEGVTLIALTVTIIVLLILASISVWMALNNDGLIKNAENAKSIAIST